MGIQDEALSGKTSDVFIAYFRKSKTDDIAERQQWKREYEKEVIISYEKFLGNISTSQSLHGRITAKPQRSKVQS